MSNQDVVEKFLTYYSQHDFNGMHDCLHKDIKFSDFAFDIQGREVRAMWHWFCVPFLPRKEPVNVPKFKVVKCDADTVTAEYEVSYRSGDDQRPVDYCIEAHFVLQNGKIVEQKDTFGNVSQFEFAKMAFGFPLELLALTPLLRPIVQKKASDKLSQFMKKYGYQDVS